MWSQSLFYFVREVALGFILRFAGGFVKFQSPVRHYARLVSTSRNIVLGETTDARTYETIFKYRVRVKTIMEMEFDARILARRGVR